MACSIAVCPGFYPESTLVRAGRPRPAPSFFMTTSPSTLSLYTLADHFSGNHYVLTRIVYRARSFSILSLHRKFGVGRRGSFSLCPDRTSSAEREWSSSSRNCVFGRFVGGYRYQVGCSGRVVYGKVRCTCIATDITENAWLRLSLNLAVIIYLGNLACSPA